MVRTMGQHAASGAHTAAEAPKTFEELEMGMVRIIEV